MYIFLVLILYCLISFNFQLNANQCFTNSSYHNIKYTNVKDQSWIEYLADVYDYDSSFLYGGHINHIEFYYLNSNVRILSLVPVNQLLRTKSSTRFLINGKYKSKIKILSHSWVEVFRYNINHLTKNFPSEGFTSPNWTVNYWKYYNSTKVPYGCWFYYAPGSGIYINVGNIKIIKNKYDGIQTHQVFGDYLNAYGCMDGDISKHCYDKYFCKAALAKGYDSIYFVDFNELIICSGKCATEEVKGSCPPIELRRGYPQTTLEYCNCSEDSNMLNCGKYLQPGGLFNSTTATIWNDSTTSNYYRPVSCMNEVDVNSSNALPTNLNYDLKVIFSNSYHSYDLINSSVSVNAPLFSAEDNVLYLCTKLIYTTKPSHIIELLVSTSTGIKKFKYASFDSEKDNFDANRQWQSPFSEYTWLSINSQLHPILDNDHMKMISSVIIELQLFDRLRIKLGIIMYDEEYGFRYDIYTRMRQIQDQSMCLQKAGAVFIALLRYSVSNNTITTSSIDDFQQLSSKHLKGYIDLMLVLDNIEIYNEVNCINDDTLIPMLYINNKSNQVVTLASISSRNFSTYILTRTIIIANNERYSKEYTVVDQIALGDSSSGIMKLVFTNNIQSPTTTTTLHPSSTNLTINSQSPRGKVYNGKISMEILSPSGKADSLFNELDDLYLTIFSDNILLIPDIKVTSDRYLLDIILSNISITNNSNNNYSMYSYMQWPNWPDRDSCYQNFKLQHSGSIHHVLRNITLTINQHTPSATAILAHQTLRYCNAEEAFRGNFILQNKIPSSGILPLQPTALFEAYGCVLRTLPDPSKSLSSSSIAKNIPNKHYIFLGDSTLELVFKGIINRIFGEETFHVRNNRQHSWIKYIKSFTSTNPSNEENRWFDYYDNTNHKNNNTNNNITNKISYPRFTFMFNGGPKPTDNMIGAALSGFPYYSQQSNNYIDSFYFLELMRIVKESILNCIPLTIFYNTGAHDIASKQWNHNYSYKLYEQGLNQSLAKLKDFIEYEIHHRTNIDICPRNHIGLKLYWVTTVPFFIFHKTSRWQCGYIYGNKGHKKLNDISIPLASIHGYEILDQYRMRYAFPIDGDGVHCQKSYYMPGPINVSSCNLLINSFLHVLQI